MCRVIQDKKCHARLELKGSHKSLDKLRWEQIERVISDSIPGLSREVIRETGYRNIVAGRAASKHISFAGGSQFDVKSGAGNAFFYKTNCLDLFNMLTGLPRNITIDRFATFQEVHCVCRASPYVSGGFLDIYISKRSEVQSKSA